MCEADVDITDIYPCTVNTPTEAEHVKRIAIETLGEEFFSTEGVPMTASEDFSFFTEEKPGAFFFIGTGKPGQPVKTLHTSDIDFNDDMVASGGHFWVRLIEDRLGVQLIA